MKRQRSYLELSIPVLYRKFGECENLQRLLIELHCLLKVLLTMARDSDPVDVTKPIDCICIVTWEVLSRKDRQGGSSKGDCFLEILVLFAGNSVEKDLRQTVLYMSPFNGIIGRCVN